MMRAGRRTWYLRRDWMKESPHEKRVLIWERVRSFHVALCVLVIIH